MKLLAETKESKQTLAMTGEWPSTKETPPGWREITPEELAKTPFTVYAPCFFGSRYVLVSGRQELVTVLVFHDGTGIAFRRCWRYDYKPGEPSKGPNYMLVRTYRFGCEHEYDELSQAECQKRGIEHHGSCYHVLLCSKCGHVNVYDSSD